MGTNESILRSAEQTMLAPSQLSIVAYRMPWIHSRAYHGALVFQEVEYWRRGAGLRWAAPSTWNEAEVESVNHVFPPVPLQQRDFQAFLITVAASMRPYRITGPNC